jgi:L-asparagine transporter-like permease
MNAPSRRDRTKPVELLGIALVLAIFAGVVVFMSTRSVETAVIFLGVIFIVTLVVLAMLSLAGRPNKDEKLDLDEQDREQDRKDGRPGH